MIIDVQNLLLWAILLGGLFYQTTMFIFRAIQGGEQFNLQKYALTYGYVAILAVITYFATGSIPGVDAVMIQLTSVPSVATILPLIMAAIFGIFQQGSKIVGSKTVATVATTTETSTGTATAPYSGKPASGGDLITGSMFQGRGKLTGIYGGSAAGNTPVNSLSFNINQIPTLFFDVIGVETGTIAMKLAIDGVTLLKWTSNNQSTTGIFNGKVTAVGERMPMAFYLWDNFCVPGAHIVTISIGKFNAQGLAVWDETENYTVTLTGTKPLE